MGALTFVAGMPQLGVAIFVVVLVNGTFAPLLRNNGLGQAPPPAWGWLRVRWFREIPAGGPFGPTREDSQRKGPSTLGREPGVASNRGRRNPRTDKGAAMRNPTTLKMQKPKTARSPRRAISPYFVDEFALTMSDVLGARSIDRSSALAAMGGEGR